jgi:hypothetical protein
MPLSIRCCSAFWSPIAHVRDAAVDQVLLGLLRHIPRIARVRLAGHRVLDVAREHERGHFERGVHKGRRRVQHHQHVALVDLLEPPNARPVKAKALREDVLVQLVQRNREVLPRARQIGEANVDDAAVGVPCFAKGRLDEVFL